MAFIVIYGYRKFCLIKKETASIATGSWLSKQPGQVFDMLVYVKIGLIEIRIIYSVLMHLLVTASPLKPAAELAF